MSKTQSTTKKQTAKATPAKAKRVRKPKKMVVVQAAEQVAEQTDEHEIARMENDGIQLTPAATPEQLTAALEVIASKGDVMVTETKVETVSTVTTTVTERVIPAIMKHKLTAKPHEIRVACAQFDLVTLLGLQTGASEAEIDAAIYEDQFAGKYYTTGRAFSYFKKRSPKPVAV
jgi:hypothetical protein